MFVARQAAISVQDGAFAARQAVISVQDGVFAARQAFSVRPAEFVALGGGFEDLQADLGYRKAHLAGLQVELGAPLAIFEAVLMDGEACPVYFCLLLLLNRSFFQASHGTAHGH